MAGISINLAGNFGKLDELKDKAHKTAASIKSSFKDVTSSATFKGLSIAATAAFAGVTAAVTKAIAKGGELNDMMLRTGTSGKNLLILQKAFENAGMSADQVPAALNRMQKALAGVNEEGEPTNTAFAKLGLRIEELQQLDPAEAFKKIASSIASISDPAKRTAAAMAIFGRAGGEMLAVMNDPGAFAQAREQIGSLGDTLPGVAGAFDAVGDSVGSANEMMLRFGTGVATLILPRLEEMVALMEALNSGGFDWTDPFNSDLKGTDKLRAQQMANDWASDDPMAMKPQADAPDAEKDPFAEPDVPEKEREKAIREFEKELADNRATQDLARQIDDEDKARKKKEADDRRKVALDERTSAQEILAGKVNTAREKFDALEYQSSIGAISSMQRIGGGGGAVSSGLDYARQAADLQREANSYLKQLIDLSRRDLDV